MGNGQLGFNIQKIYERLDTIEELVKLLLASDLLDELDLISEKDKEEKLLLNELSLYLNTLNIYERKHYKYFHKTCIELDIKEFVSVQDMKEI